MGVDLTLFPDRYTSRPSVLEITNWHLASDRITLEKNGALWDVIREEPVCLVPKEVRVTVYGDEGLQDVTTDAYGTPLTYLHPPNLANILERYRTQYPGHPLDPWNTIMLQALSDLPSTTRIILWWH